MNTLLNRIDTQISNVTMYRMVVYGLSGTIAIGIILGVVGLINYSPLGIVLSLAILVVVSFIMNKLFAVVFDAQTNYESWVITALILTLILPPVQTATGATYVALAAIIAVASKFLITYRHRHIFNPAAFAAATMTVSGLLPAIWWVGTPFLVVVSALFGIVLLRKLRSYIFFGIFAVCALVVAIIVGLMNDQTLGLIIGGLLLSSPLVFFGTIMVTEPETMPNGRVKKWLYAGLIGALVSSQLHIGNFSATPELSLLVANLLAFVFSVGVIKRQVSLTEVIDIGSHLREYVFTSPRSFTFTPGQYMELTLPHHGTDKRGNRRTFSIASAPRLNEIRFATKLFDKSSSFKNELQQLTPGDVLTVGQLNGSFVLSSQPEQKYAWIAGGIGITPFVSMARDMIATKTSRDITLFYLLSSAGEYAYTEVWEKAGILGLKVIPILTSPTSDPSWTGLTGSLTPELIQKNVSSVRDHQFYISGPHGLVVFFNTTLRQLSVPKTSIHSDYFSGY